MNGFVVCAASFIGVDGSGNNRTGLRPWPEPLATALRNGDLDSLHWSSLFKSETARFGRMDLLSRLGLMAVELLDAGFDSMEPSRLEAMGVCAETGTGCVATDLRFLQSPTAGAFAYTLSSTMLGEICIRHRFRGPMMCHPTGPGRSVALETAFGWLDHGEAPACVCLACELSDKKFAPAAFWADHPPQGGWQSCAVLIERRSGDDPGCPSRLNSLPLLARSLVVPGGRAANPCV